MDDDLLHKIVADIDELPRDGEPRSHISIGKPGSYIFITANRQGLISLARAFLTAAISPPASGVEGPRPTTIEDPHLQVLHAKEDVAIGWIEHADIVPISQKTISERKQQGWNNDRFALFGCALVGLMILFLIVSGLSLWSGIITGSPSHS